MTTSEILRIVSYICYGLAAVWAFVALAVFVRRDIGGTIGELLGRTAQREIAAIREKGKATGTKPRPQSSVAAPAQNTGNLKVRAVGAQSGEFTSSGALDGKTRRTGRFSRGGKTGSTAAHGTDPLSLAQAAEEEAAAILEENEEATAILEEDEEATAILEENEEATAILEETPSDTENRNREMLAGGRR